MGKYFFAVCTLSIMSVANLNRQSFD